MPGGLQAQLWVLGALALTLALAPVVVALLRRLGAVGTALTPGRQRRLAIVEAMALDPRRRLVILRCDGHEALLVVGGGSDALLGWLPAPGAQAEPPPSPGAPLPDAPPLGAPPPAVGG